MNTRKLKAKMVEMDCSAQDCASAINIGVATFYRKMQDNSFSIKQINAIAHLLSLSKEDICNIFFEEVVA